MDMAFFSDLTRQCKGHLSVLATRLAELTAFLPLCANLLFLTSLKNRSLTSGMVALTYNRSTQEIETSGFL